MKYKLILLLCTALCFGCANNNNDDDDNNPSNPLLTMNVYKEGVIKRSFDYTMDYQLLGVTDYQSGTASVEAMYIYKSNGEIDYAVAPANDTIRFEYNNGKITKRTGYSITVDLSYNGLGQLITQDINQFNCHYNYTYNNDNNIRSCRYDIPPGVMYDTLMYDSHVNPLHWFWPHDMMSFAFLSENNITYHKKVRIENSNYQDPTLPASWDTTVTIYRYEYQYNNDGLPVGMKEINLVNPDTNHWHFEYLATDINPY